MPKPLLPAEPGNVVPIERGSNALRMPPHSVDIERALLGAIMLNNSAFDRVAEFLLPEHFTEAAAGRTYAAISRLIEGNQPANPVTLKSLLENDELIKPVGGFKYLAGLANSMVTVMNAQSYGRAIFDMYRRREAICIGEDLTNNAFDMGNDEQFGFDPTGLVEDAIARLADLNVGTSARSSVNVAAAVDEAFQAHERIDRGDISGVSSGLVGLDSQMGLMQNDDLIVIAGRPAMGKTALALGAATFAAETFRAMTPPGGRPLNVAFFSGEMSAEQLATRLLTTRTGIPGPRNRKHPLTEHEWVKLTECRSEIESLPLVIDASPAPTLSTILARCRQLRRRGGVGLIVVDYLQIMGVEKVARRENRVQEVSYLVRGLKGVAKTIGCPVIALSQISRAVEQRENKRPTQADLRESGEIEAAADTILMLFREAYYLEQNRPTKSADLMEWSAKMDRLRNVAEAIVAKARHGATGVAYLNFDGLRTAFSDPASSKAHEPELGL